MSFILMGAAIAASIAAVAGGVAAKSKSGDNKKIANGINENTEKLRQEIEARYLSSHERLRHEYDNVSQTAKRYDALQENFRSKATQFLKIVQSLPNATKALGSDYSFIEISDASNTDVYEHNAKYNTEDITSENEASENTFECDNEFDTDDSTIIADNIDSAAEATDDLIDDILDETPLLAVASGDPNKVATSLVKKGIGKAGKSLAAGGAALAVSQLGVASTGTAISALSGAAATNATLAAFGGGSIAAGGLGMAAGATVLGGVGIGGAVLCTGLFDLWRSSRSIEQAKESYKELLNNEQAINQEIKNLEEQTHSFCRLNETICTYIDHIKTIYNLYLDNFSTIKAESCKQKCHNSITFLSSIRACNILIKIISDLFNERIYSNNNGQIDIHCDSLSKAIDRSNTRVETLETQVALLASSDNLVEFENYILSHLNSFSKIIERISCHPKILIKWFMGIGKSSNSIPLLPFEYLMSFSDRLKNNKIKVGMNTSKLVEASASKDLYEELTLAIDDYHKLLKSINDKYDSSYQALQSVIDNNRHGIFSRLKELYRLYRERATLKRCYILFCILQKLCSLKLFKVKKGYLEICQDQIDEAISDAELLEVSEGS